MTYRDEVIACIRVAPPAGVDLAQLEERLYREFPIVCARCRTYENPTVLARDAENRPVCLDLAACEERRARAAERAATAEAGQAGVNAWIRDTLKAFGAK